MTRFFAFALCLALHAHVFASAASENRAGNKLYKKGKYAEAAAEYRKAEVAAPENKAVSYNLGNALYKTGDYDQALKSYERAQNPGNPGLKKKLLFNRGNAQYRKQDLEGAVKSYKEVLKLAPSDAAAKFNLQMALQKLEQKQQQNKDQNQGKDKNKEQQQKDGKNDDKKKQEQEKQEQQKAEEQKKKEQQAVRPLKPGQMSEEEAKRLLDALKQDETQQQLKMMKMKIPKSAREKDW
ncbi:MAG: tetratricopeptide repeat protein [Fibrobacterota bacterium]